MTWIAQTLWDLLRTTDHTQQPQQRRKREKTHSSDTSPDASDEATTSARTRGGAITSSDNIRSIPMQQRYDVLVREMKQRYGIRVRKWRSSTSGCAWEVHYDSGDMVRLIESPYPRGPMSCAVFLHEIGHHAIGFQTYRPRCLEEYHAWRWALETMRERGFNVTNAVEKRMAESLRYAVQKAQRRGLRRIPEELLPFLSSLQPPYRNEVNQCHK